MVSAGTLNRYPGQPGLLELGDQARAPLLLDAERGPAAVLLEQLQELGPRQGPLVADELGPEGLHERGGAHLADAEEPLDIAPDEQIPVELLELADGVGDGEQPPGLRGHGAGPQRQVVAVPAGGGVDGFARATSAGASTCRPTRLWPRLAGCASGSTAGPAATVSGRLEASVSTLVAGAAAATSTASTPAARAARTMGAASSSTSAGRPPDRPGAATAEAGVPGAKNLRTPALGDPAAFLSGADPGRSPAGPPPFGVNLLSVLKLGRFLDRMSFDMLVNDGSKSKIGDGWDEAIP